MKRVSLWTQGLKVLALTHLQHRQSTDYAPHWGRDYQGSRKHLGTKDWHRLIQFGPIPCAMLSMRLD